PFDLWNRVTTDATTRGLFEPTLFSQGFVTALLLSMLAIICLPRQFHVGVVENNDLRHLRSSRWVLPLYLLLFAVFVLPIVAAGLQMLPPGTKEDMFMLSLPMATGNHGLLLVSFIG